MRTVQSFANAAEIELVAAPGRVYTLAAGAYEDIGSIFSTMNYPYGLLQVNIAWDTVNAISLPKFRVLLYKKVGVTDYAFIEPLIIGGVTYQDKEHNLDIANMVNFTGAGGTACVLFNLAGFLRAKVQGGITAAGVPTLTYAYLQLLRG